LGFLALCLAAARVEARLVAVRNSKDLACLCSGDVKGVMETRLRVSLIANSVVEGVHPSDDSVRFVPRSPVVSTSVSACEHCESCLWLS